MLWPLLRLSPVALRPAKVGLLPRSGGGELLWESLEGVTAGGLIW